MAGVTPSVPGNAAAKGAGVNATVGVISHRHLRPRQPLGARAGHRLDDDHVGGERQVGAVGLGGAERQDGHRARAVERGHLLVRRRAEPADRHPDLVPPGSPPVTFEPPERFNIADHFLDARVREGRGDRVALVTDQRTWSYRDVQALANRFGNLLREAGVMPEQRVIIALPDGPEFVAALFGVLKIGAVVVMVNPELKPDAISYFYQYTRARVAVVHAEARRGVRGGPRRRRRSWPNCWWWATDAIAQRLEPQPAELDTFDSHRDDACIWLFSGGTTGRPKAVVQTHRSFANTTALLRPGRPRA